MDFQSGAIQPFPNYGSYISGGYVVSPNGKYLLYFLNLLAEDLRIVEERFVVQSIDGRIIVNRKVDLDVWNLYYWLNNERIVLGTWDIPYIIDPFTGQDHTPDWYSKTPPGFINLSRLFWESKVVFDPNLSRAFYIQDDSSLILWDLDEERLLAKINEQFHVPFDMPKWTSDSQQVIFSYATAQGENKQEELFSLSRDGELRRLTYFSDYYLNVWIGDLSISPDNRLVAFYYSDLSESPSVDQIAVLNLETLEVTNFCNLSGKTRGDQNIIWAPDGQRLMIPRTEDDEATWETILLDLAGGYAWKVMENYYPSAWMPDGQ